MIDFDEEEWEFSEHELDDRCRDLPAEVKTADCLLDHPQADRQLCKPGHVDPCPAIPVLWRSHTIANIPFYYNAEVAPVSGTGGKRYHLVRAHDKSYRVQLVPRTWKDAYTWLTMMPLLGMPITAVLTEGAGPYCRCVKRPSSCGKHPETCTGVDRSNHGAGDAIDITGVVWKDPKLVGSSLRATVMHSWQDSAEQAPILVRINAALRLAFPHVIDYTDPYHRDHFHVDTNRGQPVRLFSTTDRQFVAGCLKRLGYASKFSKPPKNAELLSGLASFAARAGMQPPTTTDLEPWRPIVQRLYGCVAIGAPQPCHAN